MTPPSFHSFWPVLLEVMDARFCYLTDRLPTGSCIRHNATLSCLSGWASDTFNTVLGIPHTYDDVVSITALYRHCRWPASWWLPKYASDDVRGWLAQLGWQYAESDMAMVRDMSGLPAISHRTGFRIHDVVTKDDMRLFGHIMSTIFEREAPVEAAEVKEVYAAMRPPERSEPYWQLLIGFEQGEPVATASLFVRDGVGSINDIATRPAHRRKGIATAMFEAALQRIHDKGAAWCVLQASDAGQPLYARQGFSRLGIIDTWDLSDVDDEDGFLQ